MNGIDYRAQYRNPAQTDLDQFPQFGKSCRKRMLRFAAVLGRFGKFDPENFIEAFSGGFTFHC